MALPYLLGGEGKGLVEEKEWSKRTWRKCHVEYLETESDGGSFGW